MASKKESIIQAVKFAIFSAGAGIIQTVSFTLLTELPPKLFDKALPYWACYLPALILSVLTIKSNKKTKNKPSSSNIQMVKK